MLTSLSRKVVEFFKSLFQIIIIFAAALFVTQLLLKYVIANEEVFGPSMEPNFEQGDRLIAFRHAKIKRNDVVIIKAPDAPGEFYIKRVIGLPGDSVAVKNNELYINGKKTAQPYLQKSFVDQYTNNGLLFTANFTLKQILGVSKVPKGEYFVLGDNRPVSKDSRYFGFVKQDGVVGVVKLRYWPLNKFKIY